MKNPENRYMSDSSLENRVQGEWEATQMKLENLAKFANSTAEKAAIEELHKMGYDNVGTVVESIKNDALDEVFIRKIFTEDFRVCVPIYTSAENYLVRHDQLESAIEEKSRLGNIGPGSYLDREDSDVGQSGAKKVDYGEVSEDFKRAFSKDPQSGLPKWYLSAKRIIDHEYQLFKGKPDPRDLHMAMLKFADSMKDEFEKADSMLNDWVRQYVFRIANFPDWQTNNKKIVDDFLAELEGYLRMEKE